MEFPIPGYLLFPLNHFSASDTKKEKSSTTNWKEMENRSCIVFKTDRPRNRKNHTMRYNFPFSSIPVTIRPPQEQYSYGKEEYLASL
ncbi:hypothetical protein TNCT_368951 [Trichonephila clavata]|uniref:Uncharacterized protein n=1 Tax=Trichonephila clavata TaxID=2740835 RepID=A0A8X6EZA8_TRICU|nr:hypothetical protein TNCT_368951 [Trichonephila clavata]